MALRSHLYLLDDAARVPTWLAPLAAVGALAAVALLALRRGAPLATLTRMVVLVMSAGLILPGVTAALMTIRGLGPFAAPYEPAASTTSRASAERSRVQHAQAMEQLAERYNTLILLATDSSILAAPFILATGKEVLPIGGFQGGAPAPSLTELHAESPQAKLARFSSRSLATTHVSSGSTATARRAKALKAVTAPLRLPCMAAPGASAT